MILLEDPDTPDYKVRYTLKIKDLIKGYVYSSAHRLRIESLTIRPLAKTRGAAPRRRCRAPGRHPHTFGRPSGHEGLPFDFLIFLLCGATVLAAWGLE
jgi:hypothetical protein